MSGTDSWLAANNSNSADGPLSLELLADLHAGVLDEPVAVALRRRIATDPQARTVLAALDATVADLAALPTQRSPQMPEEFAQRLDAALVAEAQRDRPPSDPSGESAGSATGAPPSPPASAAYLAARQRRRAGWVSASMLTAAAAVVGVVALTGTPLQTAGTPRADDALGAASGGQSSEPLALTSSNFVGALDQAFQTRDFGPLSEPGKLQGCLAANDVAVGSEPLGAIEVILDGRPGVLIVLPTGQPARFQLLVVGPDCGPGNPAQLATTTTGNR